MNIAVFVSGNGSNLQALIDTEKQGGLGAGRIALVVCDKPGAYAPKRAKKAGIKTFVLEPVGFNSREEYDKRIAQELDENKIELIVLAGFMRVLSKTFIGKYEEKILNIHPALLPAFKGADSIKDAFEAKAKETGVTVHFATSDVDSGPIVKQAHVRIEESDTLDTLEEKIHIEEYKLYPEVVRLFVEGKIKVENGKAKIIG